MHPVLAIALGETDEVVVRVPVSPGSFLDGRTLAAAQLEIETGFYLLAIRRGGRYLYRPAARAAAGGRRADRTGPTKAGRASPSSAATACSRTTTPARSSSSASTPGS